MKINCLHITRSVSYTHLDVYKRQKKAQISKIENNATDARFATILKVFRALDAKINFNIESVSYTHLDVYKRQIRYRTII